MVIAGFQGEHGAYSEAAAIKYFKIVKGIKNNNFKTIPFSDFESVFWAVINSKIECGILPIENSTAGSVIEVYDLLQRFKVFITGELYLPISHCLVGNPSSKLSEIREAVSHPQALAQCEGFLKKNKLAKIVAYDTAGAVKLVKNKKYSAAIASEFCSGLYNMKILKRNVQSLKNNTTRFIIISKKEADFTQKAKTSIIFITKDSPGALYHCLGGFAKNNVNLTKIESRPFKRKSWQYFFYLDFEGHKSEKKCIEAIKELKNNASYIRFLGSYEKWQDKNG